MNLTKELINRASRYGFFPNNMLLPNPDKIVGTKGGYQALRQLSNDPHVSSCVQSRRSGLLAMDWNLLPNGTDKKINDAVHKMLSDIDIHQLMRDIIEAVLYGFQAIEIIWEKQDEQIRPKQLIAKPQEWFFFDSNGEFRYRTNDKLEGNIPPENKMLVARYEPSYLNPYGTALLSKCYWSVTFKNAGLRFWVNFMERYGMPILLGQYTRGASQEEAQTLANELSNMSEDSVIVTPADIDIQIKEPMRFSSVTLYKELIKICNDEISKALLSETLTTEMGGGTYAAARVHSDIRKEVILSDKRLVEKVVNDLIHYYVDINFKGSQCPRFEMILSEIDSAGRIKRDEILARACGVTFTKEYFMRRYGYEADELDTIANS